MKDPALETEEQIPLLSTQTVILERGDTIRGWIVGMEKIGDQEAYFNLLTEDRGMVKLSISTMLKPLKAFIGKPLLITITCVEEQALGGGHTLKHFTATGAKRAHPFGALIAGTADTDMIPF